MTTATPEASSSAPGAYAVAFMTSLTREWPAKTMVASLTDRLTNDTDLAWDRGPEPDLAGYEVVWRETTSHDWTHVIHVGDVTGVRIDLSKDNVFFGVRAVDHDGHRSPVAFPVPD